MLHSVGVEVDLLARGRRPPGREVDPEVRRLDHGLLVGRRVGAAQGGPQPGQQLVHAEGLGQVVVGAEVEGGDLVGLGLPHRQHDDGHGRPAPEAADHVEPVDAGQAEVEQDDVGVAGGRQVEGLLPAGRLVDVVAAGLQVHGEGPPDLGLVVDDQHPALAGHGAAPDPRPLPVTAGASEMVTVRPPPGVSSTLISPCIAVDEAVGDGQPEADAGIGRAVAEALEGLEDAGPLRGRDARPAVDDPEADPLLDGRRPRCGPAGRAGDQASALDTTLATARSSSAGSASTSGTVSGTSTVVRSASSGRPLERRGDDVLQRHRRAVQARAPRSAAGSCRAGWRRRGRAGPSRCRWSPRRSSRSSVLHATSCWSRLVTAALMDASGVRRSWETAWSSDRRSASVSASASASRGVLLQLAPLQRQAELVGEGPQHVLVDARRAARR